MKASELKHCRFTLSTPPCDYLHPVIQHQGLGTRILNEPCGNRNRMRRPRGPYGTYGYGFHDILKDIITHLVLAMLAHALSILTRIRRTNPSRRLPDWQREFKNSRIHRTGHPSRPPLSYPRRPHALPSLSMENTRSTPNVPKCPPAENLEDGR